MPKTLVRLYDNANKGRRIMQRVLEAGLDEKNVRLICSPNDPGCADATGEPPTDILAELRSAGVPEQDASRYLGLVQSGRSVLAVIAQDSDLVKLQSILGMAGDTDQSSDQSMAKGGPQEIKESVV